MQRCSILFKNAFLSNFKEEVDHSWDKKDVDEEYNEEHDVDKSPAPVFEKFPPYVCIKANPKIAYTF